MNFCEHCGHKLTSSSQFCGNCGAHLAGETQPSQPHLHTQQAAKNSIPIPQNKKLMGIVAAVAIALIVLFNLFPKKMNEQEYEQYVIDQLAGYTVDYYRFNEIVYDSDIDLDADYYSVAEGRTLLEPAKQYQKKVGQRHKDLKKIKPPKSYQYEHENLVKAISSFENAAAAFVSFIETGEEHYEDVFDQHEEMAESYIENSIYSSDMFTERMEEKYYQLMDY
jgi:hypothetical protein